MSEKFRTFQNHQCQVSLSRPADIPFTEHSFYWWIAVKHFLGLTQCGESSASVAGRMFKWLCSRPCCLTWPRFHVLSCLYCPNLHAKCAHKSDKCVYVPLSVLDYTSPALNKSTMEMLPICTRVWGWTFRFPCKTHFMVQFLSRCGGYMPFLQLADCDHIGSTAQNECQRNECTL